jgi:hypothetical protein
VNDDRTRASEEIIIISGSGGAVRGGVAAVCVCVEVCV